jgi:hypothetical protein
MGFRKGFEKGTKKKEQEAKPRENATSYYTGTAPDTNDTQDG